MQRQKQLCVIAGKGPGTHRAYLAERETAPDDAALFSSLRGKEPREALKPREIRNCIKACIMQSGIKGAEDKSVQSLRHTAALIALKHQEGIEDVNRHMRHKTIESTYVYMEHAEKLSNTCSHTVAHAIATALNNTRRKKYVRKQTSAGR